MSEPEIVETRGESTGASSRYELRLQDFSLADYQVEVRSSFARFFEKECPPDLVREAEATGFAPDLWRKLVAMGVTTMCVSSEYGGDDSGLVDAVIVAEELGRAMAPVPLVAHMVTSRLFNRVDAPSSLFADAAAGERLFTFAPIPLDERPRQLVPEAALSKDVLALEGEHLVLFSSGVPSPRVHNEATLALGWWSPDAATSRTVLASGTDAIAAFVSATSDFKVLSAAALVGLTDAALKTAVEFAKTRKTMGVAIGALQGVAFPLADVAIGVAGARNLALKSAWMIDNEPGVRPELPLMAHLYAADVAVKGVATAAHMQGGLGVSSEAAATMYFLRARGWSVLAGQAWSDSAALGRLTVGASEKASV